MRASRLPIAVSAVLAALMMSGCWVATRGNSARFSAPFSYRSSFVDGSFTPTGPGAGHVSGEIVKGNFSSKLPFTFAVGKGKGLRASSAPSTVRGRYAAKFDATTDDSSGSGDLAATVLIKFKRRELGEGCFGLTETLGDQRTSGKGSFHAIGGTGGSARIRISGNFTETITNSSSSSGSGRGELSGSASNRRPKGLSAACKQLR